MSGPGDTGRPRRPLTFPRRFRHRCVRVTAAAAASPLAAAAHSPPNTGPGRRLRAVTVCGGRADRTAAAAGRPPTSRHGQSDQLAPAAAERAHSRAGTDAISVGHRDTAAWDTGAPTEATGRSPPPPLDPSASGHTVSIRRNRA